MRLIKIFISTLLIAGACSKYVVQTSVGFSKVNFKSLEYVDGNPLEVSYHMEIPRGYKTVDASTNHSREKRFLYEDGSVIYMTDDEWRGSGLNFENLASIGISSYHKNNVFDTLNNEGQQKNGSYWREYVAGQVVVGYTNLSSDKKKIYDQALATLRRKEKR